MNTPANRVVRVVTSQIGLLLRKRRKGDYTERRPHQCTADTDSHCCTAAPAMLHVPLGAPCCTERIQECCAMPFNADMEWHVCTTATASQQSCTKLNTSLLIGLHGHGHGREIHHPSTMMNAASPSAKYSLWGKESEALAATM